MKLLSVLSLSLVLSCTTLSAHKVYEISAFGLKANSSKNASPVLQKALAKIKAEYKEGEKVILRFPEGRYEFHEKEPLCASIIFPITTKRIPRK